MKKDKKTFLLTTDTDLWEQFVDTIPRRITINSRINDLIKQQVQNGSV